MKETTLRKLIREAIVRRLNESYEDDDMERYNQFKDASREEQMASDWEGIDNRSPMIGADDTYDDGDDFEEIPCSYKEEEMDWDDENYGNINRFDENPYGTWDKDCDINNAWKEHDANLDEAINRAIKESIHKILK